MRIGERLNLSTFGAVGDEPKGWYPLCYYCREADFILGQQFGWQRGLPSSQLYGMGFFYFNYILCI